jgi:uncharacterized protein
MPLRPWLAFLLLLPAAGLAAAAPALVAGARAQVGVTTRYDPAYASIAYPGGDVPIERGVCADVVIRAFRKVGIDLQVLVHQDMRANFAAYPRAWGLRRTDRNIDHRRVLNLETFLRRRGFALRDSFAATQFKPGDIVTWRLPPGGLPHIGIVSDRVSADRSGRPLVIHNVGSGAREEDVLFAWPQAGHYRWVRARTDNPPGAGRARPNARPPMAGPDDHRSVGRAMEGTVAVPGHPGAVRARPNARPATAGPVDRHSGSGAVDGTVAVVRPD